jgi:hypothetical protein
MRASSAQLIDVHYYRVASKATLLEPSQLNVPAKEFEAKVCSCPDHLTYATRMTSNGGVGNRELDQGVSA